MNHFIQFSTLDANKPSKKTIEEVSMLLSKFGVSYDLSFGLQEIKPDEGTLTFLVSGKIKCINLLLEALKTCLKCTSVEIYSDEYIATTKDEKNSN